MELVRVIALTFADDGKRVKVGISHSHKIKNLLKCTLVSFLTTSLFNHFSNFHLLFRFVSKDPWVKVH